MNANQRELKANRFIGGHRRRSANIVLLGFFCTGAGEKIDGSDEHKLSVLGRHFRVWIRADELRWFAFDGGVEMSCTDPQAEVSTRHAETVRHVAQTFCVRRGSACKRRLATSVLSQKFIEELPPH